MLVLTVELSLKQNKQMTNLPVSRNRLNFYFAKFN